MHRLAHAINMWLKDEVGAGLRRLYLQQVVEGLTVPASYLFQIQHCLAQFTLQLFPVVALHTSLLMLLLLEAKPRSQTVQVNEAHGADTFTGCNQGIARFWLFVEADSALDFSGVFSLAVLFDVACEATYSFWFG
jgi:hypothetical protein